MAYLIVFALGIVVGASALFVWAAADYEYAAAGRTKALWEAESEDAIY